MRLSEDRYTRELRRYQLAARMLRHEARTRTIVNWTGVTYDRVRKLARTLAGPDPQLRPARHRGQSPHQTRFFFRSAYVTSQAAVLAGFCEQNRLLPPHPSAVAVREFPSIHRGERLCEAFEAYRAVVARPMIPFEHAILLVITLARGEELTLASCDACSALWLVDRLGEPHAECTHCRPTYRLPAIPGFRKSPPDERIPRYRPIQMPLFETGAPAETDGRTVQTRLPEEATPAKPSEDRRRLSEGTDPGTRTALDKPTD